jgi:glycogen debranching enzyme
MMKNSQLLKNVHISGLNHLLYRCENEEKDITAGKSGNYGLNEYGTFPYAGIASVLHIINNKKNLGRKWHNNAEELFKNVKGGDWLLDYTLGRLKTYQAKNADMGFQNLISFME